MEDQKNQTLAVRVMKGEGPCTTPTSIAVSKPVAEALKVKIGDPIQVIGSRITVATLESIEPIKELVAYLGRTTRPNAGAHWDEEVRLSRLIVKEAAKHIVLGPPEAGSTLDVDLEALKGLLVGTYVTVGDLLEVGRRSFRSLVRGENSVRLTRIIVVETKPSGIVQIVPETELIVSREFREVKARRSSTTYDDIGGQRDVTEKIRELVELPLRNPNVFKHLGVEPPKGVLVHGPPGTGKTLLAKAVANESGAYFISIGASHLPAHDAERRLREVFSEAEQHAPSIVFIDEIDVIAPKREESFNPDDRRTVGALLELMDGMKERGQVIVMAATNRQNALDPALRRPGRFDREIELPIPNEAGRLEILQIHARYMPLDVDVDLKKLAESTPGYSGADVKLLCTEAGMSCIGRYRGRFGPDGKVPDEVLGEMRVGMTDFVDGAKRITPSCGREVIVEIPKVRWDQVGGCEKDKEEISKTVVTPLRDRQEAKKLGIRIPKGMLLYGPPGVGKTFLAKAIANEVGVRVINVSGASLKSKWFGEFEHNIARLFDVAKKAAPVILIIDEVESLVPIRGGGLGEAGKAIDSGVNEFLRHLDGVLEIQDVFLICTTNRPDMIDSAFLRSGRVDTHLYIAKPDIEARAAIFRIHLVNVKIPLNEKVEAKELAALTEGMTGADIEGTVRSAEREWYYDFKSSENPVAELRMEYFVRAIEKAKRNLKSNGRNGDASLPL